MVYSTTRCPQCGQIIRKQTNPCHEIANPFEQCRHCGSIYLNSYKEEWITKSPLKRILYFVQDGVWARALLIPFITAGFLGAIFEMKTFSILILWVILATIWLVLGYFMHKNSEQEIVEASLKRTQDPTYINLLKRAGYKIYPSTPEQKNASNNSNLTTFQDGAAATEPVHVSSSNAHTATETAAILTSSDTTLKKSAHRTAKNHIHIAFVILLICFLISIAGNIFQIINTHKSNQTINTPSDIEGCRFVYLHHDGFLEEGMVINEKLYYFDENTLVEEQTVLYECFEDGLYVYFEQFQSYFKFDSTTYSVSEDGEISGPYYKYISQDGNFYYMSWDETQARFVLTHP